MTKKDRTASPRDNAQKILKGIVEKLRREYSPQKIILFGSYATGQARRGSDLDLLIIKDTSERFIDRWMTVQRILSDPKRCIPLETFVLTPREVDRRLQIGDQFIEEIIRKGTVLYAA